MFCAEKENRLIRLLSGSRPGGRRKGRRWGWERIAATPRPAIPANGRSNTKDKNGQYDCLAFHELSPASFSIPKNGCLPTATVGLSITLSYPLAQSAVMIEVHVVFADLHIQIPLTGTRQQAAKPSVLQVPDKLLGQASFEVCNVAHVSSLNARTNKTS